MSWLRRTLRDYSFARAMALRVHRVIYLRTGRPDDGNSVLFLAYHDMRAQETTRFRWQLNLLSEFGSFVSLSVAIAHLAGGAGRRVCLTFDDGHSGAFDHALPILAASGIPATFFVVPAWIDEGRPGTITWDQCRQLKASRMEIGSHSLTHRRLSDLVPAQILLELSMSRQRIEAEIGAACVHFACPWGQPGTDYDPARDPAMARDCGYQSFMTTIQQRAREGTDRWAVPRIRMEPGWGVTELRYALSR